MLIALLQGCFSNWFDDELHISETVLSNLPGDRIDNPDTSYDIKVCAVNIVLEICSIFSCRILPISET